ncbi:hypothetical protein HDU67_004465 [Dinochytrium kinnereticum]|nr:hypothetical protein HDU67_004465 [Dinochytrium kinnereticum]
MHTSPQLAPETNDECTDPPFTEVEEPPPRRIIIRNLDPTVTEFMLKKAFSPYGTIQKIDYLFHKTGPSQGLPRGFSFIEYEKPEDAEKAIKDMNGAVMRGRKIQVKFPDKPPPEPPIVPETFAVKAKGGRREFRREMVEVNAKVQPRKNVASTEAKIQAIEKKLLELETVGEDGVDSTVGDEKGGYNRRNEIGHKKRARFDGRHDERWSKKRR